MSTEHQPQQEATERRPATPTPESATSQPDREAAAPAGDVHRLVAPELPKQPAAHAPRPADVLRAQETLGNRRVARTLAQRQEAGPGPAASGLIVDDSIADLRPGQMRQREFLVELRTAVAATVDETLTGTPWSALADPEIERRLAAYRGLDAATLERALRREVPAATAAATARDYIPIVCEHIRARLRTELAATSPDDLIGAASGALASVAKTVAKAASSVASAVGSTLSAIGGLFFKRRTEAPESTADPAATQSRLGRGQALDGTVRSGMEAAFGRDFSAVRVHTDGQAAGVADELAARAFTVGDDVAFGAGEYRPGTPVGDALIAHELAHVAQQAGTDGAGPLAKGEDGAGALEEEADRSAVAAVVSVWGQTTRGLAEIRQHAAPRLRTGLRLQSCRKSSSGPVGPTRLSQARDNFRTHNTSLTSEELDRIDAGLETVTADTIDLRIAFYDYYTSHVIKKMDAERAREAEAAEEYAATKPDNDTLVRPDILAADFPSSKLGTLLIHEFTHTRHHSGSMDFGNYQEGDSYGVEYFLADRVGAEDRKAEILKVMRNPTGLVDRSLVEDLRNAFRTSYATMVVLHEAIDGKPPRDAAPLTTPAPLTPDEARTFVAQLVARREDGYDQRLKDIIAWVQSNFASFKGDMPSLAPPKLPPPY